MTLHFDSTNIELTCPKCSHKFKQRIGRLKNNPNITCPGCAALILIDANVLRQGIKSAGKSLDDLTRDIGKLFK
jgi:DNA-directed RNA polymerase subunit RPC12/RpoP